LSSELARLHRIKDRAIHSGIITELSQDSGVVTHWDGFDLVGGLLSFLSKGSVGRELAHALLCLDLAVIVSAV